MFVLIVWYLEEYEEVVKRVKINQMKASEATIGKELLHFFVQNILFVK
jgi:hypothetical protein